MARKKRHPEHENHERWLVSYADFITLLFAFFVVMFASSQADKGKAQKVSDSVRKALEGDKMSQVISSVLGGSVDNKGQGNAMMKGPGGTELTPPPVPPRTPEQKSDSKNQRMVELLPSLTVLTKELKAEMESGQIQVSMQPRGLVISFQQAALFPSGGDEIAAGSFAALNKVAAAIAKIPNPVRLEGHTDSQPIRNTRFRSNWELSVARSIALLEILTRRFDVPRGRFSVAGYADNAPVASNDTEEGRARNRRVDIIILNEQGILAEPGKGP